MNIVNLMIISVFFVFILRFLHKYAVRRAKYLVNMGLRSFSGNLAEDETVMEVVPILQSTTPFEVTTGRRGLTESEYCMTSKKVRTNPAVVPGGQQSVLSS